MLKIGLSACFMYPDMNRAVFGPKRLCYMESDMAAYLSRPHAIPVLVPDLSKNRLKSLVSKLDGLVLHGGSDLAPISYGEQPINAERWPGDRERDLYELKLLEYALQADLPVFGICRGMQILNTFFGGTLYQDLATQRSDCLLHRDAQAYDQVAHSLRLTEHGVLDRLYVDQPEKRVNSIHHQSVKEVGKELKIQAICAEDGVIEALSWVGAAEGKVMGVQWHPEFLYNLKGPSLSADLLYDNFLSYCEDES